MNKQYSTNPLVGLIINEDGSRVWREEKIMKVEEGIFGEKTIIVKRIFLEN